MATAIKYYPPLNKLVTKEDLPLGLGFFESTIQSLLDGLYFRDFKNAPGAKGEANFYSLTVISYQELGFEIPGTGIKILLNADPAPQEIGTFVPIKVYYRWPILRYVKDFDIKNFSFTPEAFFQLGMYLIDNSTHLVMKAAMDAFVGENDIPGFVAALNQQLGMQLLVPIGSSEEQILLLTQQVESNYSTSAAALVFSVFVVGQASDGNTMERLNQLFSQLLDGESLEDHLMGLLIPKIEASIIAKVVVEFPRSLLIPLDETPGPNYGKTLPLPTKSKVLFEAGELQFSTEGGITLTGPPTADFQLSQIGDTGFTIDFDEVNIDLSKKTNIPQATADGRPDDFIGVFIQDVSVGLPAKWFKKDNNGTTAEIFGESLLLGTGGISGKVGLRAAGPVPAGQDPVLKFKLAKNDGFEIGFKRFDLSFKQGEIVDSTVRGYLIIPGFEDTTGQDAQLDIDVYFGTNGDFSITASEADGIEIRIPNVLSFTITSLSIGRKDDGFFLALSGKMKFINSAIASILEGDFEIKKLLIYSDGNIELEGGKLPLPKGAQIQLGPAKVSITAIHFGSHQQKHQGIERKYRYFGFDGGISLNPGGVDARGDGIKFYFTTDNDAALNKNLHVFLRIESLAIDLIIPGTAKPETAVALIKGYIKLKDSQGVEEYAGGIDLKLPKARIAGGAQIAYQPKTPAFIIDAHLELAAPIPLGATGLGIYGFRGLIGLRYIASKSKVGLSDNASWFDYYTKPPVGVHIDKFAPPGETENVDNPFSVGAGASLATTGDDGKAFSSKLFLLLSLPNLILLEGKANVLAERVGLDSKDPPFFAFLALSPDSVEIGFGADYKVPEDSGSILDLYAGVQGGFFFKNPSAWYLNFGTKDKPIQAKLLSLFETKSYLMLSAAGIEAGGRVEYKFDKKYAGGAVSVKVDVYLEIGGKVSFEQPQIGGYVLVGGGIDAYFLFIGFNFRVDTTLFAEAPKPFLIKGSLHLCVGVTIGFWKFKKRIEKCFDVDFIWELDQTQNTDPVIPMDTSQTAIEAKPPVKALNMLSAEGFDLVYFSNGMPQGTHADFNKAIIPMDSYIDIEFAKGLLPDAVDAVIAGRGAPPQGHIDLIPPQKVNRQVRHEYSLEQIRVLTWSNGTWQNYKPYEALSNPTALAGLNAEPDKYKLGHWQKMGRQYNKIRLLADTSFEYLEQGEDGWNQAEELGHTAATLFCEGTKKEMHCVNWTDVPAGYDYYSNNQYHYRKLRFKIRGGRGEAIHFQGSFQLSKALAFDNKNVLILDLDQESVQVSLKLFTYAQGLRVSYYELDTSLENPFYNLVLRRDYDRIHLLAPVLYDNPRQAIRRITIEPAHADRFVWWLPSRSFFGGQEINRKPSDCTLEEAELKVKSILRVINEGEDTDEKKRKILQEELAIWMDRLYQKKEIGCVRKDYDEGEIEKLIGHLQDILNRIEETFEAVSRQKESSCALLYQLRALQKSCLNYNPRPFAYQIYQEFDQDNKDEYRWRIIDKEGEILLSSSTRYASERAAKAEMNLAFDLAGKKANYEIKRTKDDRFYFNIKDDNGEVVARKIKYYPNSALCERITNKIQRALKQHVKAFWPVLLIDEFSWRIFHPSTLKQDCIPALLAVMDQTSFSLSFRQLVEPDGSPKANSYKGMYALVSKAIGELKETCEHLKEEVAKLKNTLDIYHNYLEALRRFFEFMQNNEYQRPKGEWHCSTLVQEVCWLRLEDWRFNQQIPSQAEIEADFQAKRGAINKMLEPVWRPNGKYLLHFKVKDTVNNASQNGDEKDFYFGFSTDGPPGHYHLANNVNYVEPGKDPEEYALTSLRNYIDYKRSYPNADGKLLRSKPLYYKNAELQLFFIKRYVYHLLEDWKSYLGLPAITNSLDIIIKDPAEDNALPNPSIDVSETNIPRAVVTWEKDDDPQMPADIKALQNLADSSACLLNGGDKILPASTNVKVTIEHLKPEKLYTALFLNNFSGQSKEVHRYPFQTSRYPDFKAQIQSFKLKDKQGNQMDAIFYTKLEVESGNIQNARAIIKGLGAPNAAIATQFPDPFERVVQGVLHLPNLDPAQGTEVNKLINESEEILALWLRNPEAFNDPKLPITQKKMSIKVIRFGQIDDSYHVLLSKDGAEALIMCENGLIPAVGLALEFSYFLWDGSNYEVKATENINI